MDYFIIVVTPVAGLYFHGRLYVRIRRWMDRDLALALDGKDEPKKAIMPERLARLGDIFRPVLSEPEDLARAVHALEQYLGER